LEITYRLWPYWADPQELLKVTNAFLIANRQHEGHFRKWGDNVPYIAHPVRVSLAVSSYPTVKLSWTCASLLHDTVEDTLKERDQRARELERRALLREIEEKCDRETVDLVIELTNVKIKGLNRRQQKEEDWKRLSQISRPAKIIKMFDRIDNLKDAINAPYDFKKIYAEETLELLKVVKDGDKDLADQVESAIDYLFKTRKFSVLELEKKPNGTVFEHPVFGECAIKDGRLIVVNGESVDFGDKLVQSRAMRETGIIL